MKALFKTTYVKDEGVTMWHSHRGRLIKVVTYSEEVLNELTEEELAEQQERDATIFLRGFKHSKGNR